MTTCCQSSSWHYKPSIKTRHVCPINIVFLWHLRVLTKVQCNWILGHLRSFQPSIITLIIFKVLKSPSPGVLGPEENLKNPSRVSHKHCLPMTFTGPDQSAVQLNIGTLEEFSAIISYNPFMIFKVLKSSSPRVFMTL